MKILIAALCLMFIVLQWRFWMGNGGIRELNQTRNEAIRLTKELTEQRDINTALRAEVTDLVDGVGEIEERARAELGMVGPNEIFYQFVGVKNEAVSDNLAQREPVEAGRPEQ